jgi:hypothetical protein
MGSPRRPLRVRLRASSGGVDDTRLVTLWRRGDTIELAFERLHAIEPDPAARSAPRQHVHPAIAGHAKRTPIEARQRLIDSTQRVQLRRFGIDRTIRSVAGSISATATAPLFVTQIRARPNAIPPGVETRPDSCVVQRAADGYPGGGWESMHLQLTVAAGTSRRIRYSPGSDDAPPGSPCLPDLANDRASMTERLRIRDTRQ